MSCTGLQLGGLRPNTAQLPAAEPEHVPLPHWTEWAHLQAGKLGLNDIQECWVFEVLDF